MREVYTAAALHNWQEATAAEKPPIRFGVFGDPVDHSLSPQLHNPAFEAVGIDARYTRIHVRPGELEAALRALPKAGFLGLNITIPHKAAALAMMDDVDENACRIGAVNTVVIEGKSLLGFNTDGPGFVRAIREEFSVDVRDLRVLILGAGGGAGRAIAVQCAREGCERLALVNRTVEKAEQLARELAPHLHGTKLLGPVARLEAVPWEEQILREQLAHTDLIVNATNIGLRRTDSSPLPPAMIAPHMMVYDTIYTAHRTRLMLAADQNGARSANGLSMLLHQGALAFEIWLDQPAPLEVMRAGLKKAAG